MCSRILVLAVALVMSPLGARAADLVVWWDEGRYAEEGEAVREIIAAFEQDTGKQVELVFHPEEEHPNGDRGGAGGRPAARLRLRLLAHRTTSRQWAFDDRLVGPLGRRRPLFGPLRAGRARLDDVAQRENRPRGPVRAADGPYDQPHPRLEEPPGAGGFHARGHPEGVGRVLVVLVRPGAARGAPGHSAATTSGASVCPCRSRWTPQNGFFPFLAAYEAHYVTRDGRLVIDEPEVAAGLIEAHRQLHGASIARAASRPIRSTGTTATTTSSSSPRRS